MGSLVPAPGAFDETSALQILKLCDESAEGRARRLNSGTVSGWACNEAGAPPRPREENINHGADDRLARLVGESLGRLATRDALARPPGRGGTLRSFIKHGHTA